MQFKTEKGLLMQTPLCIHSKRLTNFSKRTHFSFMKFYFNYYFYDCFFLLLLFVLTVTTFFFFPGAATEKTMEHVRGPAYSPDTQEQLKVSGLQIYVQLTESSRSSARLEIKRIIVKNS